MRRPGIDGGFWFSFGLNLVFNAFWALPGVVLVILHFAIGTPLWWGLAALVAWAGIILAITLALSAMGTSGKANRAGTGVGGNVTIRTSSQEKRRQQAERAHDDQATDIRNS